MRRARRRPATTRSSSGSPTSRGSRPTRGGRWPRRRTSRRSRWPPTTGGAGNPVRLAPVRVAAAARHRRRGGPGADPPEARARAGGTVRRSAATTSTPWRISTDGADQRLPGGAARRAGVGGAHRRRADRPVPARRAAPGDRGRRVPRHRQGEGRPDHRPVQGPGQVPRRSTPSTTWPCSAPRAARPGARATPTPPSPPPSRPTARAPRSPIITDLTVTGRVAQFGRGVLADVSAKLLDQFVADLEAKLGEDAPAVGAVRRRPRGPRCTRDPLGTAPAAAAAEGVPRSPWRRPHSRRRRRRPGPPQRHVGPGGQGGRLAEVEPVDLLDAAGAPVAKRLAPAVVALTVLWLLSVFLRRRRRNR